MDYQAPPSIHYIAPYSGLVRNKDGSLGYMLMGEYVSEDQFFGWMGRQKDSKLPPNWKLKLLDSTYSK